MAYLKKNDLVIIRTGTGETIQSRVVDISFRRYRKRVRDRKTGEERSLDGLNLPMVGTYNVQNALAAVAIASVYVVFRFIEMRFILKENKPLKLLARDTLLVYLSVLLGNFVMEQLGGMKLADKVPQVFTNEPNF